MKNFKELGIKNDFSSFVGDKIEISLVLNCEIIVHDYKIDDSKYPNYKNKKCLCMQIEFEGKKRVIFTGSMILQTMIQKVSKSDFPFKTTIIKENKRYEFR